MTEPIINPFILWLVDMTEVFRSLFFLLTLVLMCIAFGFLFDERDEELRRVKKYFMIGCVCGLISLLIPPPTIIEKGVIAHYSTPEVMEQFDSYESFYNEIGYELRTGRSPMLAKFKFVTEEIDDANLEEAR